MKTVNTDRVPIRQADVIELARHSALVRDVMGQIYCHLLGGTSLVPPLLDPCFNDWFTLPGTGSQSRDKNAGNSLLCISGYNIEQRGYQPARLRVVAENTAVPAFYQAEGWWVSAGPSTPRYFNHKSA